MENYFKPLAFCFCFLCLQIHDTFVLYDELFKDTGQMSLISPLPCLAQETAQNVAWGLSQGTTQCWPSGFRKDPGTLELDGFVPGNSVM